MNIIKTYNNISPKGLALFSTDTYTVSKNAADPAAILLRSQDLHAETIPESVVAIGRAGAGVNNIPVDAMSARGIAVFNTPGGNANAVKELVIGMMLAASRNIVAGAAYVQGLAGEGDALAKEIEAGKKQFAGAELKEKTLGVIGLGAIGGEVANAAGALGMDVIGFDPYATPEQKAHLAPSVRIVTDINDIFATADIITVHVPLLPTTRDTVNADSFACMKKGVILLNYSRDGIVNDAAAIQALAAGTLARYVSDFPTRELIGSPGVILTPHLGASTEEAEDNCAVMAARQVRDYLEHGTIVNAVNLPKVVLERSGVARIAIIHENVPDMLGQLTHTLGSQGINIESAANGAKGPYAYTLMDVGTKPGEDVVTALKAVPHVVRVRII